MVSLITAADPVAPLENLLNPIIVAVNGVADGAGRGSRAIYYAADLNALPSSGVLEGDLCHVDEGDFYMGRGDSAWTQVTTAFFTTTALRDTAYAKASGAYRVAGAESAVTATKILQRYDGTAWKNASPVFPLTTANTTAGAVGTATASGSFGSITTTPLTLALNPSVACRVRVTLRFGTYMNGVGSGFLYGVKVTGATTITPTATGLETGSFTSQAAMSGFAPVEHTVILSLNAGTNTLEAVVQIIGAGSTRNINNVIFMVEPVVEI